MSRFNLCNLSIIAYANGFTLWHYKAVEIAPALVSSGHDFFAEAADLLTPGDQMHVSGTYEGKHWGAFCFVFPGPTVRSVVCGVCGNDQ